MRASMSRLFKRVAFGAVQGLAMERESEEKITLAVETAKDRQRMVSSCVRVGVCGGGTSRCTTVQPAVCRVVHLPLSHDPSLPAFSLSLTPTRPTHPLT